MLVGFGFKFKNGFEENVKLCKFAQAFQIGSKYNKSYFEQT